MANGKEKPGSGKIGRSVYALGIVSFLTDVSSEMIFPILPVFITTFLGAGTEILGLIEGVGDSVASIFEIFSGYLADQTGKRKQLVELGYGLSSFMKIFIAMATSWPFIFVARGLERVGKGIRTSPRDAMIADSTEAQYRGKAFGFHRAMDSFGAFLGPLVAILFLTGTKENLRLIFLVAFIPGVLGVIALAFFLKEVPVISAIKDTAKNINFKGFSPNFKKLLIATSIFAIGNSSDAFLIVRSKGLGLSMVLVILAYVLYNLSYAVFSGPFGAISDRIPKRKVMIAGYVIFAVVYIGFAFVKGPAMVWPLFFVYGLYMALTDGVGKALVSEMVGPERVATAMGLYHFTLGIFTFFASLTAGLLWTRIAPAATFFYGATMAVLSCAAFMVMVKDK